MKKAFTTVELIVTFVLSITIAIFLFQIVLVLKNLYTSYGLKTELLNKQALINYKMNDKFNTKKIYAITKCGNYCLNFIFEDTSISKLYINENDKTIEFDDFRVDFPEGTYFKDIDINVYISPVFDNTKNDSVILINIPVHNDALKDENFGIKTIYQYNSLSSNITKIVFDQNNQEYGTVILKGNNRITVGNHKPYVDDGYLVLDKDGNVISQNLVTVTNPFDTMTLPYKIGKYDIKYEFKDAIGNIIETKTRTVMVEEVELYADNSGANKPELYDKMIPVIWDGSNWIYVDIAEKWYDYDAKQWANAVVLNSGVTKVVGNTISESEIAMMYVWIPRYKYTIFNANNSSVSPQQINVVFESGIAKTGTVTCTTATSGSGSTSESCGTVTNGTSTYTHPAFTFGTKELTGIWVGKFENTAPNVTTNSVQKVSIKPNVISWRSTTVSNFYQSILNIKTDYSMSGIDSHMMRNMEWGAVAYLTQSKYGRCTSGVCTEVSRNDSSDFYTGRSDGTSGSGTDYSAAGTYQYNTTNGMLASTTGNIYGIYDMSGGAYEYVMGNMINSSNQFYSSNAGFGTTPPTKYYDSYTYDSSSYTTHSRGRLGDATKETLQTYGSNTGGWYRDYAYFPYSMNSWFIRGGFFGDGANVGMFHFLNTDGVAYSLFAARAVIVTE